MQYDVAISFAGEQRAEARAIAECLKTAGKNVFFDEYEDATLWGKDLYEHLSDVYQTQARYCIILVSSAYAQKVWTTHERRSAQARALQEKNREYILPVRFDDTDIPGLLPTIGYLNFKDYGPKGVCDAFLRKLGKEISQPRSRPPVTVSSSPRTVVYDPQGDTLTHVVTTNATWAATKLSFTFEPDDPTDGPFLERLQGTRHDVIVAYAGKVALCNDVDVTHISRGGKSSWEVACTITETDFWVLEAGTSSTSADQFAEMRTRRLLLNENPAVDSTDLNKVFREVLVAGQGVTMPVKESPLPGLFKIFGADSQRFLESAWIHLVMVLKLSNCVADVEQLELTLNGATLHVKFRGRRRKQYQNAPACEIAVEGDCTLIKK